MPDIHQSISNAEPLFWSNPQRATGSSASLDEQLMGVPSGPAEMRNALNRFNRFAPLLAQLLPELAATNGHIESALLPVPAMQASLGLPLDQGRLWVKADHSLPLAGSVKARGGFHEVLELTERLTLQHRLLGPGGDSNTLDSTAARAIFSSY